MNSMTECRILDRAACAEWLSERDHFLILLHAHPDGDTLGAGIGLQKILTLLGKTAYCICASPLPKRLSFIPTGDLDKSRDFLLAEQLPAGFFWDYVISVDVASPQLMGAYEIPFGEQGKVDLAIDHHGTNTLFAKNACVDASLAACAELVFDIGALLFHWDESNPPPADIASALYTGLTTDSGSFKYNAVTPATHRRAAVLLSSGIDHARISSRLYSNRPMREIMAEKAAYDTMRFYFDGRVSLCTFTDETMKTYGLRNEDIENVVNIIRGIEGVSVSVHIKPRGENEYKLSLRSEPGVNVAEVCSRFGGGGHVCAAGCTICGTAAEAEAKILSVLAELFS